MKKKYVFISNMASPYQVKFCYALQEYFEAQFWFYEYIDSTRPSWWMIPLGNKCKILKYSGKNRVLGYYSFSVFWELIKFKPDVVMLGGFTKWHVLVLWLAKLLGAKVAIMSEPLRYVKDDDIATTELMTKENSPNKVRKIKRYFSKADYFISMEKFAQKQFIEEFGLDEQKVFYLSYPQDIDAYFEHPLRRIQKGDNVKLLFANRLVDRYQPILALKVYKQLKTKYNISLYMNSEGSQKEECERFIEENDLKDVVFLEKIESWDSMNLIYKNCDILFLPGLYSNGNGTIIEARASGMGVVISNQINNIARHSSNGINCFICKLDQEEFVQAISKYLENPELITEHGLKSRDAVTYLRNQEMAKTYFSELKVRGII